MRSRGIVVPQQRHVARALFTVPRCTSPSLLGVETQRFELKVFFPNWTQSHPIGINGSQFFFQPNFRWFQVSKTESLIWPNPPNGVRKVDSSKVPNILQAAYHERDRLVSSLRSHPHFPKLEAVLRIIDLYEPEADARARTGPIANPDPRDGICRSPPQPAKIFSPPPSNLADRASRPRWKKGCSQSSRIRAAAVEYLRQKGKRATGREIYQAIASNGIEVTGKKPVATVCARLSASEIFDCSPEGYGLREWSDTGASGKD
jgi:hypothetical protein